MTNFKFTVYRDSWYRGKGFHDSKLSGLYPGENGRAQRMGCCLGHALCDIGVDLETFDNLGEFYEFINADNFEESEYPELSHFIEMECEAIHINDDESLSESHREELLTNLFKKNGIDVEFVNGKRDWHLTEEAPCLLTRSEENC